MQWRCKDLLCDDQLTGIQRVVDSPYFTGNVEAWSFENPLYSLIIGNIPNARDPKDPDRSWKPNRTNAVVTRQQSRN